MSKYLVLVAILGLSIGCGDVPAPSNKVLGKVGEIVLEGNMVTPDRVIREQLELYPGQDFSLASWAAAEQSLAQGLAPLGVTATVHFERPEDGGEFWHMRIRVREGPFARLLFGRCNPP